MLVLALETISATPPTLSWSSSSLSAVLLVVVRRYPRRRRTAFPALSESPFPWSLPAHVFWLFSFHSMCRGVAPCYRRWLHQLRIAAQTISNAEAQTHAFAEDPPLRQTCQITRHQPHTRSHAFWHWWITAILGGMPKGAKTLHIKVSSAGSYVFSGKVDGAHVQGGVFPRDHLLQASYHEPRTLYRPSGPAIFSNAIFPVRLFSVCSSRQGCLWWYMEILRRRASRRRGLGSFNISSHLCVRSVLTLLYARAKRLLYSRPRIAAR